MASNSNGRRGKKQHLVIILDYRLTTSLQKTGFEEPIPISNGIETQFLAFLDSFFNCSLLHQIWPEFLRFLSAVVDSLWILC